jgi:hypothetical protein
MRTIHKPHQTCGWSECFDEDLLLVLISFAASAYLGRDAR